jgi:hypothetical protein
MFRPLLAVSALTSLSLSACADRAIARNELTRASTARSQPDPRRGSAVGANLGALSIAVTAVATSRPVAPPIIRDEVEIVNVRSGLRVDVMWASMNRYQGVFLWPDNGSASQEFNLWRFDDGHFRIIARHSRQCLMLDWREGAYKNGTKVIQFPGCDDLKYLAAEWRWRFVMDGCNPAWQQCDLEHRTVLVNRATGKCLDAGNAAGGAPRQQAVLQQWDCISSINQWNAGNQLWILARATSRP